MNASDDTISFEILGEKFSIKSDVPKDYFLHLVSKLRKKITQLKEKYPKLNSVRILVLAALDLADELSQKEKRTDENEAMARLTARITELSDTLASAIENE